MGLIVGLAVGIPALTVVVLVFVLKMVSQKEQQEAMRIVKEREMNLLKNQAGPQFVDNKKFEEKTKWQDSVIHEN